MNASEGAECNALYTEEEGGLSENHSWEIKASLKKEEPMTLTFAPFLPPPVRSHNGDTQED